MTPDTAPLPAIVRADPTREAIAQELRRRESRRRDEPAGGLFDETARAQTEMFE